MLRNLTKQENRVANMVSIGLSDKEIADSLCVSVGTVKVHKQNIFEKLGISKSLELAYWVYCKESGREFNLAQRRREVVSQLRFSVEIFKKKSTLVRWLGFLFGSNKLKY